MRESDLSMEHRPWLYERLKASGTAVSEYSFANLYLFRKAHSYKVFDKDGHVFIKGITYDGKSYVMPTADPASIDKRLLRELASSVDMLFPIPGEWTGAFPADEYEMDFSDGDSDYIYTVGKMMTYSGSKLHSKKNLLNQFNSMYRPEAQPLVRERMDDARDILKQWLSDVGEKEEETDYGACLEAFELYDELAICGGIYYVDGEPAGFIMGEEIGPDYFALHFAKGKRKFKGMYQFMYNNFAKLLPPKYTYFNFEQDLGKLALKIAKSSYIPDKMLKKFRVSLNKGKAYDAAS